MSGSQPLPRETLPSYSTSLPIAQAVAMELSPDICGADCVPGVLPLPAPTPGEAVGGEGAFGGMAATDPGCASHAKKSGSKNHGARRFMDM